MWYLSMKIHRRGVNTLELKHSMFTRIGTSQAKLAEIQKAQLGKPIDFYASNERIAILIEHRIANI